MTHGLSAANLSHHVHRRDKISPAATLPTFGTASHTRNVYDFHLYEVVEGLKMDPRDQLERPQAFHRTGSVPALVHLARH
jgi:hypothetical protein